MKHRSQILHQLSLFGQCSLNGTWIMQFNLLHCSWRQIKLCMFEATARKRTKGTSLHTFKWSWMSPTTQQNNRATQIILFTYTDTCSDLEFYKFNNSGFSAQSNFCLLLYTWKSWRPTAFFLHQFKSAINLLLIQLFTRSLTSICRP